MASVMSDQQTLWLPVTCPKCGQQSMAEFPARVIVVALLQWNQLALYARCHEGSWDASPAEITQLKAHVGTAWLSANSDLLST